MIFQKFSLFSVILELRVVGTDGLRFLAVFGTVKRLLTVKSTVFGSSCFELFPDLFTKNDLRCLIITKLKLKATNNLRVRCNFVNILLIFTFTSVFKALELAGPYF